MPGCEIKDYFMSMREDIEAGAFDDQLLEESRLRLEALVQDEVDE